MQADLGGAFYEMAIRDHVRLDVLTRKAAELQRVDAELLAVERVLELERADAAGLCPGCGAPYGARGPLLRPVRARAGADRGGASEGCLTQPAASRRSPPPATPDRQTLRPARRLLAGRHLGDRRRGDDQLQRHRAAGGAARPQPRRRPHAGRERAGARAPNRRRAPAAPPEPAPRRAVRRLDAAARAGTGARRRNRRPNPNRNRPRPRRKRRPPKPGRIKHVFVISLASSGYEAAFGATPQMPYLAATLRPQGDLLSDYSLLDDAALPNSIAAVSGQPPTRRRPRPDCPDYGKLRLPGRNADPGRPARHRPVHLARLHGGHGRPETGTARQLRLPAARRRRRHRRSAATRRRLNPFVYFHSLLDLGDCAANDVPADRTRKGPEEGEDDAELLLHLPQPLQRRRHRPVRRRARPTAPPRPTPSSPKLVPKILASPAYKKDGLLIVTFGQANPAPIDPATAPGPAGDPLKVGALLVSPFVTPGATDAVAYDPYSLLRSTEDLFGLAHLAKADGAKVKSFAPALLGENGGD